MSKVSKYPSVVTQVQDIYDKYGKALWNTLEIPPLLELPPNRWLLKELSCTHSSYRSPNEFCIVIFHHNPSELRVGNLCDCWLPWI